ncbi:MAG: peptidase U32 family protein [Desulfobacterales bacterium]
MSDKKQKPEILAPAGSRASFMAALAAGADAIYCGLKSFSARMEAKNFALDELAVLTRLAHEKGTKVYVAFNAMLKTGELTDAGTLLNHLHRRVAPDALIIQDLALIELARQVGYAGELHLSTLANAGFAAALTSVHRLHGVTRVVLPRELSIDEIKALAGACPDSLALEVFVHGALCHAVSGRCYWSSFLGGKSGLRGRCVQPCRRQYGQSQQVRRYFSCQDLSLDVLANLLLTVPQVRAWKIEGRKKGPHYVYYTVQAYRTLRDIDEDPPSRASVKKSALGLLEQALGRPTTHYNFLPQRPQPATDPRTQTGSGLFVGKAQGPARHPYVVPRIDLLRGDVLRLGYEDERWHAIQQVGKGVPKRGRFTFSLPAGRLPARGTPVFLTDRREQALQDMLTDLDRQAAGRSEAEPAPPMDFDVRLPQPVVGPPKVLEIAVHRRPAPQPGPYPDGLWLSAEAIENVRRERVSRLWWWLPPVVWPDAESALMKAVSTVLRQGAAQFVLNAPWQTAFFGSLEGLNLWAGPFCNLTNPLAIERVAGMGFAGAFVSPELGRDDTLALPAASPLPLGIVVSGSWPLCISRTIAAGVKEDEPFTSPRGEQSWVHRNGSDYWMYPNWHLDLRAKTAELKKAGYRMIVHLIEPLPPDIRLKPRPGLWNWDIGLK